ncbi:MAG: glutathione S-transferase family protein [Rhodospirillales bacterium]|nr:glutathione S-transferase family protein [Rhodospirillales bacterium]
MLTFYFAPGSSSMAVHIALYEIGMPFDARALSFAKKDQLRPDHLALNPEGKVPVLIVEGKALTEVAACLYYLAKAHPEADLIPKDLVGEAQAISWMSFVAATIHPAGRVGGPDNVKKAFGFAERKLGTNEWTLGAYSIADIHLFRLYWRYRTHATRSLNPADTPHLEAHFNRMMARPAVQRTIEVETEIGYELPW